MEDGRETAAMREQARKDRQIGWLLLNYYYYHHVFAPLCALDIFTCILVHIKRISHTKCICILPLKRENNNLENI